MAATLPVLLCLLALAALPVALGYDRPLKPMDMMTEEEKAALMQAGCTGQGDRSVCDVFGYAKYYIKCGDMPERKVCGKGRRFDYVQRRCLDMEDPELFVCPTYNCPVNTRGAGVAPPQGTFGQPGNATFEIMPEDAGQEFVIFCPINGHCLGSMYQKVISSCPPPPDRVPMTHFVMPYMEYLMNDDVYPKRYGDIHAYCGDVIYYEWEQPIHLATTFGRYPTTDEDLMSQSIHPSPPQLVYQCPLWEIDHATEQAIPRANDTVLLSERTGPGSVTWVAEEAGEWMMICQAVNHCRLGMIFKVVVSDCSGVEGREPAEFSIDWVLTYDLFEDMNVCIGDSITLSWASPFMYHGVILTPAIEPIM